MLKSRYNLLFLVIAWIFPLLVLGGVYSIFLNNPFSSKTIIGAIILFGFGAMIFIWSRFNLPKIQFDENFITYRRLFAIYSFSWEEVSNAYLSKKEGLGGGDHGGIKLEFSNGVSLLIWEDFYSNIQDLRRFVGEKLNGRIHLLDEKNSFRNNKCFSKKYSQNPFTASNTLLMATMVIAFAIIAFTLKSKRSPSELIIAAIFPIIICYIGLGMQMHFFEIKGQKFVIKNHYFPWIKHEYYLNDIEEISIENYFPRCTGLRVTTYEFRSKWYGADSIKNCMWQEIIDDITLFGIKTKK